MAIISNITVDQLAQAFGNLTPSEKIKLLDLLPDDWFENENYTLSNAQLKALDAASEKERRGESVWHTWDEVKNFVKGDKRG